MYKTRRMITESDANIILQNKIYFISMMGEN